MIRCFLLLQSVVCGTCMLFIPLLPLPLECGWATEDGRDGKGNLETGTKLPKIFYVCSYFTVIMMWEMRTGLWLSCHPVICFSFSWLSPNSSGVRNHHHMFSYSSKVVLGDVLVNCIRHPRLISLHTKYTF